MAGIVLAVMAVAAGIALGWLWVLAMCRAAARGDENTRRARLTGDREGR